VGIAARQDDTMSGLTFDRAGYGMVLDAIAAAGYHTTPFRDATSTPSPAIIMRHDVDFSIDCAVRMAEFEAERGARSTYFVMLASEYYNLLAPPGRARIARLRELGHEIGLHWDSTTYPETADGVAEVFQRELAVLGDVAGVRIVSAAQHVPTDSPILNVEAYVENETYAQRFRERFSYVSDSSMQWREHTVLDVIATGVDIHFCSHAEWWFADGMTQDEKLIAAIDESTSEQGEHVREFLAYLHEVLADRQHYDAQFRAKKGAM
jgi:hypothetical protein